MTYVASIGDQQDNIEMRYEDENIWLTQKKMATLYDVDVRAINKHIKKIYSDSELEEDSTIRNFRIVQTESLRQVTRDTKHYNLQMIIAVGFKVKLEQIREIRLSQRRFYQKITDIYATAPDYDRTAKTTKQFFANVDFYVGIIIIVDTNTITSGRFPQTAYR